ncbi:unnamed protein product [Durusdinium trenchii]|uniref:Uncharacterized protein n=1 Tax=Durusdinium trenchii TaxID=1381693 RepID=A0ABP0NE77_9DINO
MEALLLRKKRSHNNVSVCKSVERLSAATCLFRLKYCCEGLFTTCTSGNTKNTTFFDWRGMPGQLERLVDKRAWRWDFFMKAAQFKGLPLLLTENLPSRVNNSSL